MKVYRISKGTFWILFALILTLPVSRHWLMLGRGVQARATVMPYERFVEEDRFGNLHSYEANPLVFKAGDSTYRVLGPRGIEMEPGREVLLYHAPRDPSDFLIFTFMSLYNGIGGMLSLGLLLVWSAFYLSFNNYNKKKKAATDARTPADSPFKRSRTTGGNPFGKDPRSQRRPRLPWH